MKLIRLPTYRPQTPQTQRNLLLHLHQMSFYVIDTLEIVLQTEITQTARRHAMEKFLGAKHFFIVVVEAGLRRGKGVSGRGPELLEGQLPPLPPLWRHP